MIARMTCLPPERTSQSRRHRFFSAAWQLAFAGSVGVNGQLAAAHGHSQKSEPDHWRNVQARCHQCTDELLPNLRVIIFACVSSSAGDNAAISDNIPAEWLP